MSTPIVSLADFASTFDAQRDEVPTWVHPDSTSPLPLSQLGVRSRIEDVLDTVIALQRADWLQDGVYAGPRSMSAVYRDVLRCSRVLHVAVPPAVLAGCGMKSQGCFGTDGRAFLYLSTFYFGPATDGERLFLAGRLCGHIAAQQVTANTLYALLVDHNGLRQVARRAVGPVLDVVLAPLSLGVRLALSRWHRAAEITADRAGMLCAGGLQPAGEALLRLTLGTRGDVDPHTYLDQLRASGGMQSPGRFTELLASEPWTHKRLKALELFSRSALWAELSGEAVDDPLDREALEAGTRRILGVS
jgi:hypothetical protein